MSCLDCPEPIGHPCPAGECYDDAIEVLNEAIGRRGAGWAAIEDAKLQALQAVPARGRLTEQVTGLGVAGSVGIGSRVVDAALRVSALDRRVQLEEEYQQALVAEQAATRAVLRLTRGESL